MTREDFERERAAALRDQAEQSDASEAEKAIVRQMAKDHEAEAERHRAAEAEAEAEAGAGGTEASSAD